MPLDPSLDPVFDAAGQMYNVDPAHLKAIALAESSGKAGAVSSVGAEGLMQLMPDTAKGLGVGDPKDPIESILGGAKYYAQGLDKYGNPSQALMYYHGGPDESQWGAKTQAYPGAVAAAFAKLQQPGDRPVQVAQNAATPPLTGTDALAAVGQPPANSVAARRPDLAAANARAHPTSDMPINVDPSLYALGTAGAGANAHFGAGPQVAQAGPGAGMSDEDLLNGFVNGTLPFLPKPGAQQADRPTAPPPNAPPKSLSPISQEYITFAQDEAARYAALGRPAPPQITAAAGMSPGLPGSPEGELLKAQAAATGGKQQSLAPSPTGGPPIVAPLPGSIASNAQAAGAVSEAQQGPQRTTEAQKPIEQRGAGSSVLLPAGSQGAQSFINAQKAGVPTAPGVTINPDGSVQVGNVNVPPETVNKRWEEFNADRATSDAARAGLFQVDNLRQKLHEIGTSGPMTEKFGELSAFAQQMGVPQATLQRFGLPSGATVEEANKLSLDLLGEVLRHTFASGGGRITNSDIATFKPTVARPNNLLEASDYMLDKIVTPQLERSKAKFNYLSDLPATDPQLTHYYKLSNDWENAHPYSEFRPQQPSIVPTQPTGQSGSPAIQPARRSRFNPDTGKIEPIQ